MEVQQMRRKISGTCILIMLMISSATSQQPPNASIEGTVVDIETGQPIPGARLASAGAAKTNDRGEYRLYWITPGRYYVVAGSLDALGSSFQSVESGGLGGSPNEYQSTGYGVTFYPGVSDPFDAVFVTVRTGI